MLGRRGVFGARGQTRAERLKLGHYPLPPLARHFRRSRGTSAVRAASPIGAVGAASVPLERHQCRWSGINAVRAASLAREARLALLHPGHHALDAVLRREALELPCLL